jgi:predicted ATPase/class 3 adenylate cyclase
VPPFPTGTVTFLLTDIEGSTRLLHELGPDSYAEALATHRRLLRVAFDAHGGVEVDTQGDSFFVAFPTAEGAVAAALEGQAALDSGLLRVRMGLHTGAPTVSGDGYIGAAVNEAARVAALAHGGQVLLTDATRALLPSETELLDLGRHRLKDIDGGVHLLQLGTGAFPPLRTSGAVDLPQPATRFLGRERELFSAVTTWVERDPRVLTVVGPGGTGKTRFTIELARLLAEDADGGTVFVPLAPLRDAALVLAAIAERLGSPLPDASSIATRVGERRTHVLIDNVEHLLPRAAEPLSDLVAAAPTLRLLVTSREPLRIDGETQLDLPPLDEDEGVELFLDRAHAVRPDLPDAPAVHELVRRLDGLPLALELAAARVRLVAPDQLVERLGQRLDLLRGSRDADARHATLRATIAWSHDLLDDAEQEAFARLAVFRSGFTLEEADETCDVDLDTLASLLDKSLLRRRTDPDGVDRLWMLETIREFARERLAERPELAAQTFRRHAERVLDVARSAHLSSEDQGRADPDHARVAAEWENVRAALDWSQAHDRVLAAEIVVALEGSWVTTGPHEAPSRIGPLLDDGDLPPRLRARLLRVLGGVVMLTGRQDRGEACYQEALDIFRSLRDEENVVALLARFAVHAGWSKEPDEARRLVAEVRAANGSVADPIVEPQMLSTLAELATREGDTRTALELTRESVAASKACGFRMWELWMLDQQLDRELELGLLDDADRTGREGLAIAARLDDRRLMRSLLASLSLVALRRGAPRRAGMLWGAVAAAEEDDPLLSLREAFGEDVAELDACVDPRFRAGVDEGRALSVADAATAADEPQTVP